MQVPCCYSAFVMGRCKPDFLGIGVQKGGTTTLHALLKDHPGVALPSDKELHYFSLHHCLGEAWYGGQFATAAPDRRWGEITPYYFFHPLAAQRIHDCIPDARLIVLLRDPVERALSQLFHSKRLGLEPLELQEALAVEAKRLAEAEPVVVGGGRHRSHQEHSYVARSRYERQLVPYEALFPSEQILLLRSEDLFEQPERVWTQVQNFLEIQRVPLPPMPRANAGRGESNAVPPSLRQSLRRQLKGTYAVMEERYGLCWESSASHD